MKHIIQYSGGVDSAVAAWLVTQKVPKEDIILLFHDVKGGHHEDMHRFNNDFQNFIGVPITEVSHDKTIWQEIEINHSLPSIWIQFCHRIFKVEQAEKFYSTLTEPYILYNGYAAEEQHRAEKQKQKATREVKYPLIEAGITSKQAKKIVQGWGLKLPQPYEWFEHNNCIPCWKSTSPAYWRKVALYYPDRFQQAMQAEKTIGHTHFKEYSLDLIWKWAELYRSNMTIFDYGEIVPEGQVRG